MASGEMKCSIEFLTLYDITFKNQFADFLNILNFSSSPLSQSQRTPKNTQSQRFAVSIVLHVSYQSTMLTVVTTLRAIQFEKVVGGCLMRRKKMPWGGLRMVPISLQGDLQKRPMSLRSGITTGSLYYCGVVNFFHPPKFYRIPPPFFVNI